MQKKTNFMYEILTKKFFSEPSSIARCSNSGQLVSKNVIPKTSFLSKEVFITKLLTLKLRGIRRKHPPVGATFAYQIKKNVKQWILTFALKKFITFLSY